IGAAREGAAADFHIANAAGHFRADRQAGETAAQFAVGDLEVLGGLADAHAFGPAAGLERDRVVAGVDVAVIDLHVARGIDVDAVAVGGFAADREVLRDAVLAIRQANRPNAPLADGKIPVP